MRNAICTLIFVFLIVGSFLALHGYVNDTEAIRYIRPSIFTMNLIAICTGFFIAGGLGFASTIVAAELDKWKRKQSRRKKTEPVEKLSVFEKTKIGNR